MKIDFNKQVIGLDKKPIRESSKDPKSDILTLKSVAMKALLSQTNDQAQMDGTEKFKRGELARKIYNSKAAINLTPKQVGDIREQIGKIFIIEVVTVTWDMLDSK